MRGLFKNRYHQLAAAACLLQTAGAVLPDTPPDYPARPLAWLEERLTQIDDELISLADISLRSGTGAIGYRSDVHEDEFHSEWIQIDFGAVYPLDEVVLVPVIRRDAKSGFQADGFPKHFRVIAGTGDDRTGSEIAAFRDDNHLPRTAPLSIPCGGRSASWIRIEADRLSLRAFDNQYVFQLSEVMAFSGAENAALRKPVTTKSDQYAGRAWAARFVADGIVPYLMDAAAGEKSVAFISRYPDRGDPMLTIDLGEPQAVDRLHLHAIDPSDVLPQAQTSDFGIPKQMILEGADRPDFSDARTLTELHQESIYNMAPIMAWDVPESTNRFYRLHITAPPATPSYNPDVIRFGFAEIELISNGKNRALGKPVEGTNVARNPSRPMALLTDGRNMYGTILPIRDWMRQLIRRHDLEAERPLVEKELTRRYEKQKTNLRRLGWLSALLAAGIGFTILIDHIIRMRHVRRIEQRLAADLHDELGANLHTIGLLSDLADGAKNEPEELGMLLQRIRAVTERSGIAVRNCTNMLGAEGLHKGLPADMQRAAQRILPRREHDLSIEGKEYLDQLNQRACFDLFMFYKECLVNISRHSGATHLQTKLKITPQEISLAIKDNGRGLPEAKIPSSLKRRARLLGAKVHVESPADGGTRIQLNLQIKKRKHFIRRGHL